MIQTVCGQIQQGQNPSIAPTDDSSGAEQVAAQGLDREYARLVQAARRLRPAVRARELVPRLRKSRLYVQRVVTLIDQVSQIAQSVRSDPTRCWTLPSVMRRDATGLLRNGNLLSQDVAAMRQILNGVSPGTAAAAKKTATIPG